MTKPFEMMHPMMKPSKSALFSLSTTLKKAGTGPTRVFFLGLTCCMMKAWVLTHCSWDAVMRAPDRPSCSACSLRVANCSIIIPTNSCIAKKPPMNWNMTWKKKE